MSGDLLTLRMMTVSGSGPTSELWREAAALASVPIELTVASPAEALVKLKAGGLDVVVFDAALAAAEHENLLKAARTTAPFPLIAMSAPAGAPRADGIDQFAKPASWEEARNVIERCIRQRLPRRVLIVDDSRTMRSIVRKILSASRFNLDVSEAEEGAGALEKLGDGYDIVLLDYNMPGFSGIETLAEIKRVAPRVAVVMMTSAEEDVVAARAQASGAAAFLKKPFYPADIDAVLERIYDKRARNPGAGAG
jgi:DNA-binding NtrC family response regulator